MAQSEEGFRAQLTLIRFAAGSESQAAFPVKYEVKVNSKSQSLHCQAS